MAKKEKRFEVLSAGEMREKYYSPDEKPIHVKLDPKRVPESLRRLIPLAERWGIGDDILRAQALTQAAAEDVAELRRVVASIDDELDDWLAGPEAQHPPFSPEYLAFTHMRMAADGV